jgi:hypothetical protein
MSMSTMLYTWYILTLLTLLTLLTFLTFITLLTLLSLLFLLTYSYSYVDVDAVIQHVVVLQHCQPI